MIDGYDVNSDGIIYQEHIFNKQKVYDIDYIDVRYNSYGELGNFMSYLRLGYLIKTIGHIPRTLLDVGYGNGDFLKLSTAAGITCFGSDISGYPVPSNVTEVTDIYKNEYEVVCFFDVLEHFNNIHDISELQAEYIYISVPECHNVSDEWFKEWRHRRPDEHLWHFNKSSLESFMGKIGYTLVAYTNVEDLIRKPEAELTNILTGVFKTA